MMCHKSTPNIIINVHCKGLQCLRRGKKEVSSSDGFNSGSKKCKQCYGGAYGGV
jgi:hypothetical protein